MSLETPKINETNLKTIPDQYFHSIIKSMKTRPIFLVGRFNYEDVHLQVRLIKISSHNSDEPFEAFYLNVSFERFTRRILQLSSDHTQDSITQIRDLLRRFQDWKHGIMKKRVHFINDTIEPLDTYHAKLFLAEWTSGEPNDICYICHEPCLFYESAQNCSHPIHKLCFVKMIQNDQSRCGICKKYFSDEDEDDE